MKFEQSSLVTYAITGAIIAAVFALRWRRMSRARPLKLERLWVFPAFYAAIAVALYVHTPPVGWGWVFCVVALVAGAGLGWQRGKMMRIAIDPETHALNQIASPAATLFIVLLVVVRSGARELGAARPLGLDPTAITDMLVALALGLFTAQRVEMYLRGRRMLATRR